jgi:hypothetical protein
LANLEHDKNMNLMNKFKKEIERLEALKNENNKSLNVKV